MRRSKYEDRKPLAIKLRKRGLSLPEIEKRTGIPRSNLSSWLKAIPLTKKQEQRLHNNWLKALVTARKEAVKWHNEQKQHRLDSARMQALATLNSLDTKDKDIMELALAVLYLGEGTKKKVETSLGSSDPKILRFYIKALESLYSIRPKDMYCQLFLRHDQDIEVSKKYWSKELKIPISCFRYCNFDDRTKNKPTVKGYNGVCLVRGGSVAIQRKLVYLANAYFDRIGTD